jgi:hypothetical protein
MPRTSAHRRIRALATQLTSGSGSGSSAAIPEQAEALELQAEQRRLTGSAAGYRPESVTPWVWDTEQTVEGIRWSYSHTRELTLTANVARGDSALLLPVAAQQLDLAELGFTGPSRAAFEAAETAHADVPHTVESMLVETHTDAFLVLHRGELVAERYFHGADSRTKRLGMSMTKTYTSMLVGILAERGEPFIDSRYTAVIHSYTHLHARMIFKMHPHDNRMELGLTGLLQFSDLLTDHLPELSGSGYAGATVQHALDMCVAVDYDESAVYSGTPFLDTKIYNHTIAWGGFPETVAFREQVRKQTPFCAISRLKMIVSIRQARDKHRES